MPSDHRESDVTVYVNMSSGPSHGLIEQKSTHSHDDHIMFPGGSEELNFTQSICNTKVVGIILNYFVLCTF